MRPILYAVLGFSLLAAFADRAGIDSPTEVLSVLGPSDAPYEFTEDTADGPVRWRTCSTVPVLVNPGPTGEAGLAEIREAVARVAAASGVRFEVVGSTDAVPQSLWARNGQVVGDWPYPAVLIAWVPGAATDLIDGGESGAAVGNPAAYQGVRQIVTGAVALNSDQLDRFAPGFGPGSTRGNLILHELGHVVGLTHVGGRELMNPRVDQASPDGFGGGDLQGLAALSPRCE